MSEEKELSPLEKWRQENPDHVVVVKTPWEKLREKNTRRTAIDAFCHHCYGWNEDGARPEGVRADIKDCSVTGCPLYDWRPYS